MLVFIINFLVLLGVDDCEQYPLFWAEHSKA